MRGLGRFWVAAIVVCAALAAPAGARDFPADAQRARFTVIQFPVVKLGRQTMRLAPGAQIRDETNLIVLPTALDGTYHALYTIDLNGDVSRVWLLTPDELAWLKSQKR